MVAKILHLIGGGDHLVLSLHRRTGAAEEGFVWSLLFGVCSLTPSVPLDLEDGVSLYSCLQLDRWWASTLVNAPPSTHREHPTGSIWRDVKQWFGATPRRPETVEALTTTRSCAMDLIDCKIRDW